MTPPAETFCITDGDEPCFLYKQLTFSCVLRTKDLQKKKKVMPHTKHHLEDTLQTRSKQCCIDEAIKASSFGGGFLCL